MQLAASYQSSANSFLEFFNNFIDLGEASEDLDCHICFLSFILLSLDYSHYLDC